jgi:hypothetical protein
LEYYIGTSLERAKFNIQKSREITDSTQKNALQTLSQLSDNQ